MRWLCSSQDRGASQEVGMAWHTAWLPLTDGPQAGGAEAGSRPTQFLPQGLILGLLIMAPGMGWQLPKGKPSSCRAAP